MRDIASNYWLGKNVLVTGLNGFIGGNLAKALIRRGANVIGVLRNIRGRTFISYEDLSSNITFVYGDITDCDVLSRIISEERIDAIYHLAAQVEVGIGIANPFLTFETNIRGTYSLMEAVRRFPGSVKSIVVASTDKSYGSYPVSEMPYKEDYPLVPKYPYDVSKACADLISQSFATDLYKLPIVVTRFCNIYGPGQLNFSAIFPDSIRACLGYGSFVPRGNGSQQRDFIYIDDVVELYLTIGERLAVSPDLFRGQIYNAGTNKPTSVKDALRLVYQLTNNETKFEDLVRCMEGKHTIGEIDCQFMNFDKVEKHFGWRPTVELPDGLKLAIGWYAKYFENSSKLIGT